jgi:hypothetical protein
MFIAKFGDFNGKILGEVTPNISECSWRINEVGQVNFTLPINSRFLTNEFVKYGNTFLVIFSNGLPNWGGIIDPPGIWDKSTVSLTAYSAEILLSFRLTSAARYFAGANAGYIFRKVIEEANAVRDTGILVLSPSYSVGSHYPEYHYMDLLKLAKESLTTKLSSSEFQIVASEENGYIRFDGEIDSRIGTERRGIALVDGRNITDVNYEEQGPIINNSTVVGAGNTWGDSRPKATVTNDLSQYEYRLRESSVIQSDTTIISTLKASAENLSRKYSQPRRVANVTLIDAPPAHFGSYALGDTILTQLPNSGIGGFNGLMRIKSRSINPSTNTCTAILEEETE